MSQKTFLDKAYTIDGPDGISQLYADWAESYEAEIKANGYATPDRIADALARVVEDKTLGILDYGCGTGLSGKALSQRGFSNITGADPTPQMLAFAKTKGIYSALVDIDVSQGPPFETGEFSIIAAVGVIGVGAAPVGVFDALFNLLLKGQKLALSLNDHTLQVPQFPDRIANVVNDGQARLIFEEMGDHLPGQNMKSIVYILEKT